MYLGRLVVRDRIAGTLMSAVIVYQDSLNSVHTVHCHNYSLAWSALVDLYDKDDKVFLRIPLRRIFEIRP